MNERSPKQGLTRGSSIMHLWLGASSRRLSKLGQEARRFWAILYLAVKTFLRIDGAQWAGAFAFTAFFSLFPLMILLVTIASSFVDRDRAVKEVIAYMESYVPINGEMQRHVFDVIAGVIDTRERAGAVAFFILVWVALQCFTTLICATNRAGTPRCLIGGGCH